MSSSFPNRLIQRDTNVLLLRNSIVERFNLPTDYIFTIKFLPGGLEAILGVNQVQLIDQVGQLETGLPIDLIQRVKQLNGFEERIALLEDYFLSALRQQKKTDHFRTIVSNTIGTFETTGLVLNPGQLTDARAALAEYVTNRKQFAPETYGYYDMSHFYKDVVKFTGQKVSRVKL